jgi:hypothetical protein
MIDINNFNQMDPVMQRKISKAFIKFYNGFITKVEAEINKELDDDEEKS